MTDYIDYGQSVINFHILFIGYSLKCYKGVLQVAKDTTQEQMEKKPKLGDCAADEVCVSTYFKTDIKTDDWARDAYHLAGGWEKGCEKKGGPHLTKEFGEDHSDRCAEPKDIPSYEGKFINLVVRFEIPIMFSLRLKLLDFCFTVYFYNTKNLLKTYT